MYKITLTFLIATSVMAWTASAADFNLVAYTGHYNSAYPFGTIEDLEYIPIGPNGWPGFYCMCGPPFYNYCDPEQIEIFLFISTDLTDKGVGGIDLADPNTVDEFGNPRPSGIFSGDWDMPDPYVGIHNGAHWAFPPPPGTWTPIHGEHDPWDWNGATAWNGYNGYVAHLDTWYFYPFNQFVCGAVQENPSSPPGNAYTGNFYKGVGRQWDCTQGWFDEELGKDGNLVPYMHLVLDFDAMPCCEITWITIAGLPTLVNGQRPADYNWLGRHMVDQPGPWVPMGRIEYGEIPEPASLALLALAGVPVLRRRR